VSYGDTQTKSYQWGYNDTKANSYQGATVTQRSIVTSELQWHKGL